jgi:hypothetical protein
MMSHEVSASPLTPFVASLQCIRRRTHILIEHREPKDLSQLSANATTACYLSALSLQRFRPLACLFSTASSLFCKNTRGYPGPIGGLPIPETVLRVTRVECPSATPPRSLRLSGIICSGLDRSFVFITLQIHPHALSINMSRLFTKLQIPPHANSFFSHRYKTPGCAVRRSFWRPPGVSLPPPLLSRLRKLKLTRDRMAQRLATPRTPA